VRHYRNGQVRIIGGQLRGRKLSFPAIDGLRPSGDRMRETLFNWLQTVIAGARCVDLFAGSGALGFEALSRGAAQVELLEKHPQICAALRQNAQSLGLQQAHVHCVDAQQWLQQAQGAFDLVFMDPPFSEARHYQQSIELLQSRAILAAGARVYVEAAVEQNIDWPQEWQLLREKKAGQVMYRLFAA